MNGDTSPACRDHAGLICALGFPKIKGTLLGAPVIRVLLAWVLYWGPAILGN